MFNDKDSFYWLKYAPFHSYSIFMKNKYGERLQKISINAGNSCPNRDGTKGVGGCIYCLNEAFTPSYCTPHKSIKKQIEDGIIFHKTRYRRVVNYLAYFQSYSNTYNNIEKLKYDLKEVFSFKEIKGVVISTRPDCINNEILNYLKSISEKYLVFVEYGAESFKEDVLKLINRGHTVSETINAIEETKKLGFHICIHLIFGLPGFKTREEELKQVEIINSLPIDSIKLHQLQILKNTRLSELYLKKEISLNLFTFEEYLNFVISFLEKLKPTIVVERLVAEVPPRYLLQGSFGNLRNDEIIRLIIQEMRKRKTYQGRLYV